MGKMTAVDWLGDVIEVSFDDKRTLSLIKQAKEAEKNLIIKAYEDGKRNEQNITGKQYYNKNYK